MIRLDNVSFDETSADGLRFNSSAGTFHISLCGPHIVRVSLDGGSAKAAVRYAIGQSWPEPHARVDPRNPLSLNTDSVSVEAHVAPFRIDFGTATGITNLQDATFAFSGPESDYDNVDAGVESQPGDGTRRRRWRVHFRLPAKHHFYGLGHGGRQLDRVGAQRQLWNSHVVHGSGADFGVPFLVSNRGYALLFDSSWEARVTIGRSDTTTDIVYEAEGGPVDFYYLCANNMREVLKVAADLIGRASMPPLWSLGFLQSTRHFAHTKELSRLAAEMRARRFPCDALIFLSTYNRALGWNRRVGDLEFEPNLWRRPETLIREMKAQHFEIIMHEYPVLHRDSVDFEEAERKGYLLAEGYSTPASGQLAEDGFEDGQRYIDFSNNEARRWWWDRHHALVDLGVSGWWLDGGEGPPADSQLMQGTGRELHNAYDLLRCRAFAEGEAQIRPDLRPVLICRSGASGMQRYGASCWSGDINNTFAALAAQIPAGLNTALSGIPFWGTDIGGFFQPIEESGELFARWFQFGAFCPLFRAHGHVWRDHLPWAFGPQIEAICRKYAALRYALLPYTYTLAWQAATTGLPLMRPLVLNYPEDPRVWDIGDEYLWGDDILVAPVTREGARKWAVYLPEGVWYDYWSWARFEGKRGVEVDAPLDRLPLFVREGAIIPTAPPAEYVSGSSWEEMTWLIIPSEQSSAVLYEDDGYTNQYKQGSYAVTTVGCTTRHGQIIVKIDSPTGDVISQAKRHELKILARRPSEVVDEDGVALPELSGPDSNEHGWWIDGRFVHIRMPNAHGAVQLF